ncbi:aldehyde dehydrogenase [Corynebacterium glutamicum MT]|uniref:Aldehyde dehydrogenase n=1 Tax=Corynebacterium glutamicum TaxID=1718 RepID=A0AB36I5X4_CORGT|nr:aldehyde dehydrogenase [Corynebacterium glutamicum]AGN17755.1 aldehyde dehydrogenase [Corynebacterium glutamicum SCgG1]AGN20778.1 aldehyde dehydrogenase [Corynebacterium glutamicum SCgG2]EGV39945.1 aldehyde dehydrogenase [Corynebacterium glutamicum S9114]EOA65994.1 aldehyde dehydrogenase [Corynebacterium glutamicum MT]EPP42061.1 aldehyde dehydrogenase [Corynebacterium glutamicum Z188]
MTIEYDGLYIDGQWMKPSSVDRINVYSTATEDYIGSVPEAKNADIDSAVEAARRAFDGNKGWSSWTGAERATVLKRFADEYEARGEEIARRVTAQNGMPTSLSQKWETTNPAQLLRFYADMVSEQEDEIRQGVKGKKVLVTRSPIGVVGAIVPWNVPQSITFLKLAPSLAAGCTVVLKPSPETVLDAFLVAEAAHAAGLPAGVLNVVPAGGSVSSYIVSHPLVDKISFTGSPEVGRLIGETCGRMLRPVTLELGGKSAAIVLDDCDLSASIDDLYRASMTNNGQVCWLSTRILLPESRYEEMLDIITAKIGSLKVGDPFDPDTEVGPLVSKRHRERVEALIKSSVEDGARILIGGKPPKELEKGWFLEPTILVDVDPKSVAAQKEFFGPVLSIIKYTDEDHAIEIANDSDYGLAGSVWSVNFDRAVGVAKQVFTGTIGINGYATDPSSPFGGVKDSGLGRELGPEGLAHYQVLKSVYLLQPNDS